MMMIISSASVQAEEGYNRTYIGNFFNTDALDENTTSGVFMYFFIIFIFIGMIVFSEWSKIPIIMVISGVLGFFISLLLYSVISAIIGVIFAVISVMYIIRSIAVGVTD